MLITMLSTFVINHINDKKVGKDYEENDDNIYKCASKLQKIP